MAVGGEEEEEEEEEEADMGGGEVSISTEEDMVCVCGGWGGMGEYV